MKKILFWNFENEIETFDTDVKVKEFEMFDFYIDELTAPSEISVHSRRELDYLRVELPKLLKKIKNALHKPEADDPNQPKLF